MQKLSEPLLGQPQSSSAWYPFLLLTMISLSMTGMVAFKKSVEDARYLIVAYTFEALAFIIYPFTLRYFRLQLVVVCWSAASNILSGIVSISSGESNALMSLGGMVLSTCGVAMVAYS